MPISWWVELNLTCASKKHSYEFHMYSWRESTHATYREDSLKKCLRKARKDGWYINQIKNQIYCKHCKNEPEIQEIIKKLE